MTVTLTGFVYYLNNARINTHEVMLGNGVEFSFYFPEWSETPVTL